MYDLHYIFKKMNFFLILHCSTGKAIRNLATHFQFLRYLT